MTATKFPKSTLWDRVREASSVMLERAFSPE